MPGARDRATSEVADPPLPGTTKGTLQGFACGQTAPGAQVRSHEAVAYVCLEEFAHEAVKHSGGE